MLQKYGLFLNQQTHQYEIVGVRKVRRDYLPTDECEPLPFLTKGNLIVFGIDKREPLPTADEVEGTILTVTALDLSRLRKENMQNEPKKWEPVLQAFVDRQMRYVKEMETAKFQFKSGQSLADQLMVQKRANLAWDDAAFADGIIYPVISEDQSQPFIKIDLQQGRFVYVDAEQVEEMPIGPGIFGRMRHVKWPKPTAEGLKVIAASQLPSL